MKTNIHKIGNVHCYHPTDPGLLKLVLLLYPFGIRMDENIAEDITGQRSTAGSGFLYCKLQTEFLADIFIDAGKLGLK